MRRLLLGTAAALFFTLGSLSASGARESALAGKISSPEEGAMAGVLGSARAEGSTLRTTVVSDAEGRYSFPADRLPPGRYTLTIRAAGYDLGGPAQVELAAGR